jgi:hypothetical protein
MGSTSAAFVKILRDANPHFIAAHDEIRPRIASCRDSRSAPKSVGENKRRRPLGRCARTLLPDRPKSRGINECAGKQPCRGRSIRISLKIGGLPLDRCPVQDVCFSNRPSGVKRFQAIHHSSVDVAHGLALLFGLGTKALPSWDSKTRWNNLLGDLAVNVTAGSSGHTNSPHPSSREGQHSTAGWSSSFLLLHLILHRSTGTRCRQPTCGA